MLEINKRNELETGGLLASQVERAMEEKAACHSQHERRVMPSWKAFLVNIGMMVVL